MEGTPAMDLGHVRVMSCMFWSHPVLPSTTWGPFCFLVFFLSLGCVCVWLCFIISIMGNRVCV